MSLNRGLSGGGALAGIALIVAGVTLFSGLDALTKWLVREQPVGQVVWARYASHLALMALLLGPRLGRRLVRTARLKVQLARGLLLLACTALFLSALVHLPLAETTAIAFATPLLVTALSVPLLGERVGWRRWAAVAVGFAGVLLVIRPGGALFHWAALLVLAMALCNSLYHILTRLIAGQEDPLASLFYTALTGTAAMTLLLPLVWAPLAHWSAAPLMLLTGAFGGAGHYCLIRAYECAPASLLAPFSYFGLLSAGLLGWLVFGDLPDAWSLAGMAVICGSGVYVWWRELVRARAGGGGLKAMRESRISWSDAQIGIELDISDHPVVLAVIQTPAGRLELMGSLYLVGGELRIEAAHIDGLSPGALGRGGLNAIARRLLEVTGAETLVVEGSRRTTGARPDRVPKPFRFPR